MSQNYEQLLENVSGKLLPDQYLLQFVFSRFQLERFWAEDKLDT